MVLDTFENKRALFGVTVTAGTFLTSSPSCLKNTQAGFDLYIVSSAVFSPSVPLSPEASTVDLTLRLLS